MVKGTVTIQDARLIFRDFSAKRNKFNNDRTTGVILEKDLAMRMMDDGWPVRFLEPRNEEDEGVYFIKVKVKFREDADHKVSPKIMLVRGGKKQQLTEKNVDLLDWARLEKVDIKFSPYNYTFNGREGVSAYLQILWVVAAEDELELKYKDIPYASDDEADDETELPFN